MLIVNRNRLVVCKKCDTAIQYKDEERKLGYFVRPVPYNGCQINGQKLKWIDDTDVEEIKCLYIICPTCNHIIIVFKFPGSSNRYSIDEYNKKVENSKKEERIITIDDLM